MSLPAQGFELLSGRHEGGVEWNLTRSGPVELVYPERLASDIPRLLATALESYHALSAYFKLENPKPVRIYLTDRDEIPNGYAVPISGGHAFVWVGVTTHRQAHAGRQSWEQKVIWHEMAHLLHGQAVSSPMGRWSFLLSDPMPLVWAEGVAQYLAEEWDVLRGERYLRSAIFDPDYREWDSGRTGRYARGHSMVRYLAQSRGDSTLVGLMHRRTGAGWFKRHSFKSAFREETGITWDAFHREWETHVSIDLYSRAARSERTDSLGPTPWLEREGALLDLSWRPDGESVALLMDAGSGRPVPQLLLANPDSLDQPKVISQGRIRPPIDWSPWSDQLVYTRLHRTRGGALEHDLYLYDMTAGREIRLTSGARTRSPAFGPHGVLLAALMNEQGTDVVVLLDRNGVERVRYKPSDERGVLQGLVWNHVRDELYVQQIGTDGSMQLLRLTIPDLRADRLPMEEVEFRRPHVSPDGDRLLFTSLKGGIPNLFQVHLDSLQADKAVERMTNLFTGGVGLDWVVRKSTEEIYLSASETVRESRVYSVSPERRATGPEPDGLERYRSWRTRSPWSGDSSAIDIEGLQVSHQRYRSFSELRHAATLALPWATGRDHYGLSAGTLWMEPMAQQLWAGGGALSIPTPGDSGGFVGYLNRTLRPTIWVALYRSPFYQGRYGDRRLIERRTGGTVSARWMIDNPDLPGSDLLVAARLKWDDREPWTWSGSPVDTRWEPPRSGDQLSAEVVWMIRSSVQGAPLVSDRQSGYGIRLSILGSDRSSLGQATAMTADLESWIQFPLFLDQDQLHLRFRLQSQWGSPYPQDRIGLNRTDRLQLPLPFELSTFWGRGRERVRGYREFLSTDRLTFVSAEYRFPMLPSLKTTLLGAIRLGASDLVLFADAAITGEQRFRDRNEPGGHRIGTGVEWLNRFSVGPVNLSHALGIAQPTSNPGGREIDFYYRLRTRIPF